MLQKIALAIITCAIGIVIFIVSGCFQKKQGKREAKKKEEAADDSRSRGRKRTLRGWGVKLSRQAAIVVVVVVIMLLITIVAGAAVYLQGGKKGDDDIPDPTLPGAVGSTDDLIPVEQVIEIWPLLYDGTYSGTGTKAGMLDGEVRMIRTMLDTARKDQNYFGFPEGFQLHSAEADTERKTASSLEEYDKQLADAVPKKEYYWTANIALSCLRLCKNTGDRAKYEYYGELAVWGLTNWYVSLGEDASSEQLVDLAYWAGQAYDHLGGVMTDDTRQGLYFVSAAFLELAVQELMKNGFQGGVVDEDVCWDFYLTMLERLELEMDADTGYGARADEQKALHPIRVGS